MWKCWSTNKAWSISCWAYTLFAHSFRMYIPALDLHQWTHWSPTKRIINLKTPGRTQRWPSGQHLQVKPPTNASVRGYGLQIKHGTKTWHGWNNALLSLKNQVVFAVCLIIKSACTQFLYQYIKSTKQTTL